MTFRYKRWELKFFNEPIPFALLLFFFAVAISLLPDFHQPGDFRYFFFGCAHAVMMMDLCGDDERQNQRLLMLIGLAPALLVLRGIVHDPSTLSLDHMTRLGFPLDHPNTAGYVLSMSIPIAVGFAAARKGLAGGVSVFSAGIQAAGLFLTYSRGAWLGAFAALICLAAMTKSWKVVLCILIVVIVVFAFAKPLRDRVLTLASPQADMAMRDRMQVMKDAVQLGVQHPFFGIGYGRGRLKESLRNVYKDTANENNPIWHAHNVYVELFAETGIVGLGAFLWLIGRTAVVILRRAYAEENQKRLILFGLGAAWLAAAITGFGDIPFYHHETRIFFFTIIALGFCLCRKPGSR